MRNRYLVIQSFPEGMVAVIRHTVHGLLLAELTGRVPIILWKGRFLYHNNRTAPWGNGLTRYFETKALTCIQPALEKVTLFAPTGWNASNIDNDHLVEFRHEEKRPEFRPLSPHEIVSSRADVIVYTHYQHLVDILPLIPKGNEYHGCENALVARRIYQKYFKLAAAVSDPLLDYMKIFVQEKSMLGIHCRGSDKISEYAVVSPRAYQIAASKLSPKPGAIFLATDSAPYLEQFKTYYGNRLLAIDCARSETRSGVHFSAVDRELAGRDFLIDAYLLGGCSYHLGNYGSHVSYLVQAMIRTQGMPFDNFQNVQPLLRSKAARLLTYQIPLVLRQNARKLLQKVSPSS